MLNHSVVAGWILPFAAVLLIADPVFARNSAQIVGTARYGEETFDRHQVIVQFRTQLLDDAESSRGPGESIADRLGTMSRLRGLRGYLRLRDMRPVFRSVPGGSTHKRVGRDPERRRRSFLVKLQGGLDPRDVLWRLRSHPDVVAAQLNYIYTADLVPNDPLYAQQFAHRLTDAELGWDLEIGAPGVAIAVIGTGIELQHPDLSANIWENTDEIDGNGIDDDLNGYIDDRFGWNFSDDNNDPNPAGNYHETGVAGVAAAVTDNAAGIAGVAWNCRIMALRVAYTSADVANAIDYATDNGARVINMSFGNYDPGKYGPDTIVEDAAFDAFATGVVLVGTAGNNSINDKRYPAALDEVIAVAATTSSDQRAGFSNYGSWVTVAAPGAQIKTTGSPTGYTQENGTSYSAPYVAGIAALLLSADASLSPTSVRHRIEFSVDLIDPDYFIGTGRVNVFNALSLTADPDHFAVIRSPLDNSPVPGLYSVEGTALGDSYDLEYRATGDRIWTLVSSGAETIDGELGVLDLGSLGIGSYELRLTASLGPASLSDQITVFVGGILKEGWPQSTGSPIVSTAAYADVDGDGTQEVFISANNGKIHAWYTDGTSVPGWPVSVGVYPFGSPAIGDIDGDGSPDILQGSYDTGKVYAFDRFGVSLPGWPQVISQKVRGSVVLADLDGDGVLDVIATGFVLNNISSGFVQAFHGDGTPLPGWPVTVESNVQTAPVVADLDGDGDLEVLVHGYTTIYAFEHDGSAVPGFGGSLAGVHTSPRVVVSDGTGNDEVLVFGPESATLLGGNGAVIATYALSSSPYYSSVGIGDLLTGPGPGAESPEFCVSTDTGSVFAFNLTTGLLPGWPVQAAGQMTGCTFADVDGDGEQEVLATGLGTLVHAWNADGSPVAENWPLSTGTPQYGAPVVADIDGDGLAEVITGGGDGNLLIIELEQPVGSEIPIWSMHQGGATHDGRYPPVPVPEPGESLMLLTGSAVLRLMLWRRRSRYPR